ncbi:MAG: Ig-like domain-containing protein [Gemmatimonadota bacterium]
MHRTVVLLACTGFLALAACDESLQGLDPDPPGGDGTTPELIAVTGQTLVVQLGGNVATPLRVRVLDASGRPVRSAVVKFNVLTGAGIFSADSTLTNDQGFTEVTFRPTSAGTVLVEARVEGPTGTDRVQFNFQVFNDPTIGATLERVSGTGQTGPVGSVLPDPLVVRVLNPDGFPVANLPVTFTIQQAQGDSARVTTTSGGPGTRTVVVTTDSSGVARAFLRLGTLPGAHTVSASAVVTENGVQVTRSVSFTATATGSTRASLLVIISGDNQTAIIDTIHERDTEEFRGRDANPLVVQAVDRFGTPVAGVVVQWRVSDGGGQLASFTTSTDFNGLATNTISDVTVGRNAVVAFTAGAAPVEFVITGELYEPPAEEEEESEPDPDSGG